MPRMRPEFNRYKYNLNLEIMKKLILTFIIIAISTASYSQKINIEKTFGGYKFTQNGKNLRLSELVNTMKSDEQSYSLAKSAKSNYVLSQIIGGAGGFMVGWPLGTAISGGKPNWTIAGIGAGLIVISIPITSSANKKMKKAVNRYNSSINSTSYNFQPNFSIVSNRFGVGLAIIF